VADKKIIARKSVAKALRTRQSVGLGLTGAICVYDLAERLGVEVRFLDIPSMEGMYYSSSLPHIILSSLRPPGRRAFTCAHELGHHIRSDGTRIDHLVEQSDRTQFDPSEFAADCFAGALLMPKLAVEHAFAVRKWDVRDCTAGQAFVLAGYFGVGYTTLIRHMRNSLSLLPDSNAEELLRIRPREAQSMALGREISSRAWIVDSNWAGRPVDVEVDDLIFARGSPRIEGACVELVRYEEDTTLLRALRSGIARLEDTANWAAFVRVSRPAFVGRNIHRHLENVDEH